MNALHIFRFISAEAEGIVLEVFVSFSFLFPGGAFSFYYHVAANHRNVCTALADVIVAEERSAVLQENERLLVRIVV